MTVDLEMMLDLRDLQVAMDVAKKQKWAGLMWNSLCMAAAIYRRANDITA